MGNIKNRLAKLEKVRGGNSPAILIVKYVSPAGTEPFTPEETETLDDYLKQVEAAPAVGGTAIKVIFWSREKAQELLALADKN